MTIKGRETYNFFISAEEGEAMTTQTQGFDPYTTIKRLAEAEWGCLHGLKDEHGNPVVLCARCLGTGRIVPFASLREDCPGPLILRDIRETRLHPTGCQCDGRTWIPEPDVEKACWRIHTSHPYICYATTIEEELRAAEVWLEEEP